MRMNLFYPADFSPVLLLLSASFGFVFPSTFAQHNFGAFQDQAMLARQNQSTPLVIKVGT